MSGMGMGMVLLAVCLVDFCIQLFIFSILCTNDDHNGIRTRYAFRYKVRLSPNLP